MSIFVTKESHPCLHEIMVMIEEDNGGHLIGTVYPGTPIDLERFEIPDGWVSEVAPAEAALAKLKASHPEEFETFAIGEHTEIERLIEQHADLRVASQLLEDWFDDWQTEGTPAAIKGEEAE